MTFESIAAEIIDRIEGSPDSRINKSDTIANLLRERFAQLCPPDAMDAYVSGYQKGTKQTMNSVSDECRRNTERLMRSNTESHK